jgi:hypothetical protein
MLMEEYGLISEDRPGWSLSDIRSLTRSERSYWSKLMLWKRERLAQDG